MTETRKLAAILIADVPGHSRLAGPDEEGPPAEARRAGEAAIHSVQGLTVSRLAARKGASSRVATEKRCAAAIAAI